MSGRLLAGPEGASCARTREAPAPPVGALGAARLGDASLAAGSLAVSPVIAVWPAHGSCCRPARWSARCRTHRTPPGPLPGHAGLSIRPETDSRQPNQRVWQPGHQKRLRPASTAVATAVPHR